MNCPVCDNAMITLELEGVEIDYSPECGGIWLDAGELEILLNDPQQARTMLDSLTAAPACTEKSIKCPICLKKMQKTFIAKYKSAVLIDRCTKGDGVWFDKNELQLVLNAAEPGKESKISKLLSDMFGLGRQTSPGSRKEAE